MTTIPQGSHAVDMFLLRRSSAGPGRGGGHGKPYLSIDFIAHKKHHELSLWRISQGKRVIFMSSVATTFYLPPAGGGEEGGRCKASQIRSNTPGRSCKISYFQNCSTRIPRAL